MSDRHPLIRLHAEGRGRNYSPRRGLLESTLRLLYRGDWPGRLWGRIPRANRVLLNRLEMSGELNKPLRIAFASDLHFGPTTSRAVLDAARDLLVDAEPDLLLLGGDFVFLNSSTKRCEELQAWIDAIPASRKLAVLGNHDLWADNREIERALEGVGVELLINRNVALGDPWGDVIVAGLDDSWTGFPSGDAAFAGVPPGSFVIALAHSPDAFREVLGRGAHLMLCGHTHGGHIALPGHRPIYVPCDDFDRLPYGFHGDGDPPIYVSRGVGGVEIPVRTWAPPDVAIIDITPRGSSSG